MKTKNSTFNLRIIKNFPPCWGDHISDHVNLFGRLTDGFRHKMAIRKNDSKYADISHNTSDCDYSCYLSDALTIDAEAKKRIDKRIMAFLRDAHNIPIPDDRKFRLKRVLHSHPEIAESGKRKIKDIVAAELSLYIQSVECSIYAPDKMCFATAKDFLFGSAFGIDDSSDSGTLHEWYKVLDETELVQALKYDCYYDAVIMDGEYDIRDIIYRVSHMAYDHGHITAVAENLGNVQQAKQTAPMNEQFARKGIGANK